MTPDRYTEIEGGDWLPWGSGEVSDYDLDQRHSEAVMINGNKVHSLITRSGRRWDCLNGDTGFTPLDGLVEVI